MSHQREILGKFGSKSGIFQHCQSFKNSFSRFFLSTLKFSYQPSKLINPEFQEIHKKSLSTLNPFWLINPQLRVGTKLCYIDQRNKRFRSSQQFGTWEIHCCPIHNCSLQQGCHILNIIAAICRFLCKYWWRIRLGISFLCLF